MKTHRAFTMVEVVFVVVILGIVGVAGGQAILKVYENYLLQGVYHQLELESRRLTTQVSRQLENAVWETIKVQESTSQDKVLWRAKNLEALQGTYRDIGGGGAMNIPLFTGFVDLENSTGNTIKVPRLFSGIDQLNASLIGKDLYFARATKLKDDNTPINEANRHQITAINATADTLTLAEIPEEISDIAYVIEPEVYRLRLVGEDLSLQIIKQNGTPESHLMANEVKSLELWKEGQDSLVRIRLCLASKTLYELLKCKSSEGGFCQQGFCKESVVIQ